MKKLTLKFISALLSVSIITTVLSAAFTVKAEYEFLKGYENIALRVGVCYGTGAVKDYDFSSDGGFSFGRVENNTEYILEYTVSNRKVNAAYLSAYHFQLMGVYSDIQSLKVDLAQYESIFKENGLSYFVAKDSEGYRIRFGKYANTDEVNAVLSKIESLLEVQLCVPRSNRITITDVNTGAILYQSEGVVFALASNSSNARTTLENNAIYGGCFELTKTTYGMTVINIVDIEEYVAGVLPYEIYSTWSLEMQKTFAIIARTYALFNLKKHKTYNFDVCTTTACQVYGGYGRVTSTVLQAVKETKGQVLTYGGKLCETLYSSSLGGSSISSDQAFGGYSYPYLVGNIFDWEPYDSFPSGKWQSEVSAKELCDYLKDKGYSVSGYIKSVEIAQLADNSTYVYILNITDGAGNVITLKTSEKIRTTLSTYLKSANFTVLHNVDEPTYIEEIPAGAVMTADGIKYIDQSDPVYIETANGRVLIDGKSEIFIYTPSGLTSFSLDYEYEFLQAIKSTNEAMKQSAYITASFVFDGKGFGHGVGLSQYGANYLASIGKKAPEILLTFYPNTTIMSINA